MTKYYQCDNCRKTSSEHELVWINKEKGDPLCRHCWGFVSYAFAAVDQPEPSLGYCDGCDELEAELHPMGGNWLCDKCKATGLIRTGLSMQGYWCRATGEQIEPQDVEPYGHPKHGWIDVCPCHHLELTREKPAPRESDTKLLREELQDLKTSCTDHWEMIKARVFITIFLVWVCFAVWGKYNGSY